MSDWNRFKNKMKEKRCHYTKKDSGKSLKDLETTVVRRLSAEVSGKAQKYTKNKNPGPSVSFSEPCTSRGSPSKFVPRSLSVAEMLRLGKLITKTTDVIDIHHFNMTEMAWSEKQCLSSLTANASLL